MRKIYSNGASIALKGITEVNHKMFAEIADTIAMRKKDAVLNVRVNSHDLKRIKYKAARLGIRYQTFIAELIHRASL